MSASKTPEISEVTVQQIVDLGNETRHYELAFPEGKRVQFTAGQFVAVLCPHQGKVIRRAYSIASPPERSDQLDLCIKRVEGGVVTNWFWTLKVGDRIKVHGPFGKFILPEPADFDPLFVATGTGIAPFRSMIHHLLKSGFTRRIDLLFGSRYETMIPYDAEWRRLAEDHSNFHYLPTISRPGAGWTGETGYVQTKIEPHFGKTAGRRVYICGLNEMIQAVREACLQRGYDPKQVEFEKYD
ncbi:MAG: oxidoreductase [Candidatus Omnitrophica bacterium CG11_big_fil_rev_8_21_14_0_20_64_10]|nr:MAG: oxidoreductase [Candidatus Omnitrophica bacterium CG11_big_fil_rev_8_21_14_0_20_64_10]